ncbi:FecR family protein [Dysgonomonas sp. BGC7]|uniref:FecR family protein n=1 Tax=Dysgonomonas sp. BGC7 TaxID=1658008 RepID=UPI000682B8AF|nr:FecR family protein [Dysgonomonas sp. BGC7]MBD8387749.1 FecR domain-containing protein [Dysgonomonas sp. BGC7]
MDLKKEEGKGFWTGKTKVDRLKQLLAGNELFRRFMESKETGLDESVLNKMSENFYSKEYSFKEAKSSEEATEEIWNELSKKYGFQEIFDLGEMRKESLLNYTKEEKFSINPFIHLRRYAAVAAILLIVFGSALTYVNYQNADTNKQSLLTEVSEKTIFEADRDIRELKLPDGSVITINRGSKISVVKDEFNKDKREVWLEEGEAFFNVAKNPDKPFIVHSGEVQTVVKGTSFNIKAYKELNENVVSVRSGRVEVNASGKLLDVLTENRQIVYNRRNGSFEASELQAYEASGWMDGKLILNHADGKELQLRIRQFYGIELVIHDGAMVNIVLQASFIKGTTLTQLMESLKLIYGINYKISNDKKQVFVFK